MGGTLGAIAAPARAGGSFNREGHKAHEVNFIILAPFVADNPARDAYFSSSSRSASLMLSLVIAAGVIRLIC